MKVYDCFTFFNEFELLELRLKSLYDVVDYFVLIEADKTQINQPKPFYFDENKERFAEFLPKIRNLKIQMEVPYKGTGDWSIENAQRNSILYGLQDAAPDDLIFISDLDEIWAPDILQRINNRQVSLLGIYTPPLKNEKIGIPCQLLVHAVDFLEISPIAMDQQLYYYYFNWTPKNGTWQGTVLTKFKNLEIPQDLRNSRTFFPRALEGGWHFSWMGGADKIIEKMTSIVDGNELVEQSGRKFIEKKHVEEVIKAGGDLYGRKGLPVSELVHCDISTIKLPYIQEFVKKYPQFLKPQS